MAAGLVTGTDLAVDGSTVQADANPQKRLPGAAAADDLRVQEAVARPVREHLAALDAALPPDPDDPEPGPAPLEPKHVSPTDPQAGFTMKGGPGRHARAINPLLDLDTGCILGVEATPARFAAEVGATRVLVARVKNRLGLAPVRLAADKASGSAPLLAWLLGQGVTPHVPPVDRTRQRPGFLTRDAFVCDPDADACRCPAGKVLPHVPTCAPRRS